MASTLYLARFLRASTLSRRLRVSRPSPATSRNRRSRLLRAENLRCPQKVSTLSYKHTKFPSRTRLAFLRRFLTDTSIARFQVQAEILNGLQDTLTKRPQPPRRLGPLLPPPVGPSSKRLYSSVLSLLLLHSTYAYQNGEASRTPLMRRRWYR